MWIMPGQLLCESKVQQDIPVSELADFFSFDIPGVTVLDEIVWQIEFSDPRGIDSGMIHA